MLAGVLVASAASTPAATAATVGDPIPVLASLARPATMRTAGVAPTSTPFAPASTTTTAAAATTADRSATAPADPFLAAGLPSRKAWTRAVRRTRSWAASKGARLRFSLRVEKRTWSFRGSETTNSNSLIKATVLVAYVRRASVRRRALTRQEKALLSPMIRRSANEPVNPLLSRMGGVGPLRAVGRLVGMTHFRPRAGLWGASRISALDEVRLFHRLWRIIPPRHRTYALGLLRSIVPSQRWGMPRSAPRGWRVTFKSGWNGSGRVNQAIRLNCKGRVITASVLVDGSSHGGSIGLVEGAGRRLFAPLRARGAKACSSVVRTAD